jgi:hypothetical protein
MTREFVEKNAGTIQEKLTGMGATFKFTIDKPEELFLKNGYRQLEKIPVIEKAVLFEAPDIPADVWATVQPTLPQGYDIHVFETVNRGD